MRWLVAMLFEAAVLMVGGMALAGAPSNLLRWQPETRSPQRGSGAKTEVLYATCGALDRGLVRVAARVVARKVAGLQALSAQELKEIGKVEGVPQPWLRAWSLTGRHKRKAVEDRLRGWLGAMRGQPRCGVARGLTPGGERVVSVVVVDALADLAALGRHKRRYAWVSLRATLHLPATAAKVVLLGPRGEPKTVLASLHAGQVRSRFRLDRPGRWLVQLLAQGSSGPLPVAEATIFVDRKPPTQLPVERASKNNPSRSPVVQLFRLINRERRAEGRAELRRSAALDAVARHHAEAMMRAGRVAHDLGQGGPHIRVAGAGIRVRMLGENVAKAGSVAAVHRALWSSPSHRQNILAPVYDQVGVAVLSDRDGRSWAVELFAR